MAEIMIFLSMGLGGERVEAGMSREFQIFASDADSCFTFNGIGEGPRKVFSSLFEAARHARTQSGGEGGVLVIYDEAANAINRIPFSIPS
jgi:hypothetical protein